MFVDLLETLRCRLEVHEVGGIGKEAPYKTQGRFIAYIENNLMGTWADYCNLLMIRYVMTEFDKFGITIRKGLFR